MENQDYLKSLPKIEVSFQDDFSGSQRELYLTPRYVLRQLISLGIFPHIGDEILFWEKDTDADNKEDYICAVGKILEATNDALDEYTSYGHKIALDDLSKLEERPIVVKIGRKHEDWFRLPLSSLVFQASETK